MADSSISYVDVPAATARRSRSPSTWRLPSLLLALFIILWLALAIAPVSRQDWLLENLLVLIAVPTLVLTRHRLRFSDGAYVGLFVFFVLHSIGAHYTYALVPYDRWWDALTGHTLSELLGLERNHYDRLVHFMYGALLLPPSVELLDEYAPARGLWRSILPVTFVMSHSVLFELIEWGAASIVAPDLGNAYLGTQGDPWDAQQDMALAALGAVISMLLGMACAPLPAPRNRSGVSPMCAAAPSDSVPRI